MFSNEICEISKNIYFEEHLRTTAFISSSFKLDLVDLTVFRDLNLTLAKIKPFTKVCISDIRIFAFAQSRFFFLMLSRVSGQLPRRNITPRLELELR